MRACYTHLFYTQFTTSELMKVVWFTCCRAGEEAFKPLWLSCFGHGALEQPGWSCDGLQHADPRDTVTLTLPVTGVLRDGPEYLCPLFHLSFRNTHRARLSRASPGSVNAMEALRPGINVAQRSLQDLRWSAYPHEWLLQPPPCPHCHTTEPPKLCREWILVMSTEGLAELRYSNFLVSLLRREILGSEKPISLLFPW